MVGLEFVGIFDTLLHEWYEGVVLVVMVPAHVLEVTREGSLDALDLPIDQATVTRLESCEGFREQGNLALESRVYRTPPILLRGIIPERLLIGRLVSRELVICNVEVWHCWICRWFAGL